MTRQTSIETYNQIKTEGLLSKLRLFVYDYIYNNGPVTQRQAIEDLTKRGNTGSINTRFSELERQGVVYITGKTVCRYTGRQVYLWDVTDKLPVQITRIKSLTRKQLQEQNEALISIIRSAIFYLFQDDNQYYSNILKEKLNEALSVNKQ